MQLCDHVLEIINEAAQQPQELNYLRGYMGLRSNGVVKNFVSLSPKMTKNLVHLNFLNSNGSSWRDRFEKAGIPARKSRSGKRFRITVTPQDFKLHQDLIREAILETVNEFGA